MVLPTNLSNLLELKLINIFNFYSHPTSCASMAEIMSVLFFHTMRYKVSSPKDPSNDRFILSKGHAAPILYAGNVKYIIIIKLFQLLQFYSS